MSTSSVDLTPQLERSKRLDALSRRRHHDSVRHQKALAAVSEWPYSLVWRQELERARAALHASESAYLIALGGVPWVKWGLIDADGP